jgi:putative salt-induced outer membrane protein
MTTAATAQDAPPVKLTLDLGFVNVSGNTEVTTLNLGEKLSYATGRWTFGQSGAVIYGQVGDSATAEQYDAALRGDYAVGDRLSAFANVTGYRNTFAGIARRFVEGAGLAFKPVVAARDTLRVEAAMTLNQEWNLTLQDKTFGASRVALAYKRLLGATAFVTEHAEWSANLQDSEDQRLSSETALVAPISRRIALKASYVIRFDNQPEPGFKDTDRVLTTGVQIVF